MKKQIKNIYIKSIEANDIYSHQERNMDLENKYVGMIPFSLELEKLISIGFKTKFDKQTEKAYSNDIINVKFSQSLKSSNQLIKKMKQKIDKLDNSEKTKSYKSKLEEFITLLQNEDWQEKTNDWLREELYTNGFAIKEINPKTNKIKSIEYVVYKRSTSKSRTGQCLFIKKSLHKEMINWSRMYLPLKENIKIDYPSLLAYESLVGSALEDIITIPSGNILIVNDINSVFTRKCNVIKKGTNGFLDSFEEETEIKNSLYDGESLLDSKYFLEGQSMLLLRNHFFKSAAFNTNIKQFLVDNCPDGVDFDNWKIKGICDIEIFAKDIELIITPNSLKALKFSSVLGSDTAMFKHWIKTIEVDGCRFGVVKHEKKSKYDDCQQMSYQMINSLPATPEDIKELAQYDIEYITKLKNNDEFFIDHILENANDINSNKMFAGIYKINNNIVNTRLFRDFRKKQIINHKKHIGKGKIRIPEADYCVLLGNPLEFLYHAIGKQPIQQYLKDNEVYTRLFNNGEDLVLFRNPHTSANNVLLSKNKDIKEIDKYFNLNNNIICVNAIENPIQDILSSCDYDSDTAYVTNNPILVKLAYKCKKNQKPCINKVDSQKKNYELNNYNMYIIDAQLAKSQKYIGKVVNVGQLCLSKYHDTGLDNKELEKKIDVVSVLSTICIDLAKKLYDIDVEEQINYISKSAELSNDKPLFWKYVAYFGRIRTPIPVTSGQHFGIIRTA